MDGETLEILRTYKKMAQLASNRDRMLQDSTYLTFLVYVMDDKVEDVVYLALKILHMLTEQPRHCRRVQAVPAVAEGLRLLEMRQRSLLPDTSYLARSVAARLAGDAAPLADQTNRLNDSSSAIKRPAARFIRNRTKTLQFRLSGHPLDHESRRAVESALLSIKGVISIYFDAAAHRCVVGAKPQVSAQVVGAALLETALFVVERVERADDGEEVFEPLDSAADEGRASPMPAYLPESLGNSPSPRSAAKTLVRADAPPRADHSNDGWLGSVSSFFARSFYW